MSVGYGLGRLRSIGSTVFAWLAVVTKHTERQDMHRNRLHISWRCDQRKPNTYICSTKPTVHLQVCIHDKPVAKPVVQRVVKGKHRAILAVNRMLGQLAQQSITKA